MKLKIVGLVLLCFFPALLSAEGILSDLKIRGLVDLRIAQTDDTVSWLDGGLGKTRYGSNNDSDKRLLGRLSSAALVLSPRFNWDFTGHFVFKYDPEQYETIDITEGFVAYRPISTTAYRIKSRLGMFFPPVSLENKGIAWTTPYTITPSAINTWIGEEVRTLGAEFTLLKEGDEGRLSLSGALYKANDPTGSLLAYRGWAMHDRTLALNDRAPLAAIASIQPGQAFEKQVPWVEPFLEIDGSWGYYVALGWDYQDLTELRVLYYDNRADPAAFNGSQYAWDTRFLNVGLKVEMGDDWELLAQWMTGNTVMGIVNGLNAIDNDFQSAYLLLSKRVGDHRYTLRYDTFEVTDEDQGQLVPNDLNDEDGDAWTLAYTYRTQSQRLIMIEAMRISSERPARAQIGAPIDIDEVQLQASYRIFY